MTGDRNLADCIPCTNKSSITPRTRDILGFIETESAAAAATIAPASLDARVPSCPDWSLAELIWHLGSGAAVLGERRCAPATSIPSSRPTSPVRRRRRARGLVPRVDARAARCAAGRRRGTRRPGCGGRKTAPSAPSPATRCRKRPCTVGTRNRAIGTRRPVADDGSPSTASTSSCWIARQLRGPEPIAFHATDTGDTFSAGPGAPACDGVGVGIRPRAVALRTRHCRRRRGRGRPAPARRLSDPDRLARRRRRSVAMTSEQVQEVRDPSLVRNSGCSATSSSLGRGSRSAATTRPAASNARK